MRTLASLRPAALVLIGATVMFSLSMGLRQSLGLFMPPLTRGLGISISEFTFAIAVQNLTWGVVQPFAGAAVVRLGFRPVMLFGCAVYALSMAVLASAGGWPGVLVGAGIGVGVAVSCTASAVVMAIAARSVPAGLRSSVMGMVSAGGSLGALIAAPVGAWLSQGAGWRTGLWGFAALALLMLPAAWWAGRVDRLAAPVPQAVDSRPIGAVLRDAVTRPAFVVMALAYFVCGMQLVFLTTHLPSYLDICGLDPMLGAQALATIGGFNVLGSLFFGWAGGRWNKQALLGAIYIARSGVLAAYFVAAPTPAGTLLFAAVMGFLWLGVAPLVAGSVVEMFGLRWQALLAGLAFTSHQLGSFFGAFGGGLLFDVFGSYELAWRLGVGLGLAAGTAQLLHALVRPVPRPAA